MYPKRLNGFKHFRFKAFKRHFDNSPLTTFSKIGSQLCDNGLKKNITARSFNDVIQDVQLNSNKFCLNKTNVSIMYITTLSNITVNLYSLLHQKKGGNLNICKCCQLYSCKSRMTCIPK